MNNNIYKCLCDPSKTYKNRKAYEKHMNTVHKDELEDFAIKHAEEVDCSDSDSDEELLNV